MSCHALLLGIFPKIESTAPEVSELQADSLSLSYWGSPFATCTPILTGAKSGLQTSVLLLPPSSQLSDQGWTGAAGVTWDFFLLMGVSQENQVGQVLLTSQTFIPFHPWVSTPHCPRLRAPDSSSPIRTPSCPHPSLKLDLLLKHFLNLP